jgi:hypothetical protein
VPLSLLVRLFKESIVSLFFCLQRYDLQRGCTGRLLGWVRGLLSFFGQLKETRTDCAVALSM